ncbi:WD repeat-containing protein 86 [Nymphon striatum]|nr:WD repeat-containing protein 86 [Nymphon striatum]
MGGNSSKDMEHPSYDSGFLLLSKPEIHSMEDPRNAAKKISGVNTMDISDDGSLLATGGEDCVIRLWSTQACHEEPIGVLTGHKGYISCVTIYDDFVISGSNDFTVKKWSVLTENCIKTYTGHTGKINRVICDGNHIFTSSDDKTVKMWLFDVANEDPLVRTFTGHHKTVFPITLVTNEAIQEFKVKTLEEEKEDPDVDPEDVGPTSLESFKVQDVLLSGSGDCTVRVWSTQDGELVRLIGSTLYTGSSDQTVRAWSLNQTTSEKMTSFRTYRGHEKSVGCIRVHNGYIYSGSGDGHTRMFHYSSEKQRRTFTPDNLSAVACMEMTRGKDARQSGAMLFTGTNDGSIYVWDISGVEEDNAFGMYITDEMCVNEEDSDDENISNALSQM